MIGPGIACWISSRGVRQGVRRSGAVELATEDLRRPPATAGVLVHVAGIDQVRLHRSAEREPAEVLARDRFMDALQLAEGEPGSQQPVGIGLGFVPRPDVLLGKPDDLGVIPGQLACRFTGMRRVSAAEPDPSDSNCSGRTTATWATESTQSRSSRAGSSNTHNCCGRTPRTPSFVSRQRSTASARVSRSRRKVPAGPICRCRRAPTRPPQVPGPGRWSAVRCPRQRSVGEIHGIFCRCVSLSLAQRRWIPGCRPWGQT